MSFGKIFESTFTGSMVGSGSEVFAVWAYVIANTRPPGLVEINPVILASMIGADVNDIESALEYLQTADPRSRSKDCEGKRLIKVDDFLYSVPTWQKYRDSRNDEERRAYNAEAARKHRAKVKASNKASITVIDNKQQYAKAEAEAEAEKDPPTPQRGMALERRNPKRPTLAQAISAGQSIGITQEACAVWWHKREASDWMKGTAGGGTTPIGSWHSDLSASKAWAEDEAKKSKSTTPQKIQFVGND